MIQSVFIVVREPAEYLADLGNNCYWGPYCVTSMMVHCGANVKTLDGMWRSCCSVARTLCMMVIKGFVYSLTPHVYVRRLTCVSWCWMGVVDLALV